MQHPYTETRSADRQRVKGTPQVDVAHSAAAGQLVLTVHVDVPDAFVVPPGIKANIAEAVQAIVFSAPVTSEEAEA